MRLIDADKVKRAFIGNRYGTKAIEYVIDNVPTVNAIPIEWIEKKCRELYEHLYLDESLGVQMLLRDWEKDNEQAN